MKKLWAISLSIVLVFGTATALWAVNESINIVLTVGSDTALVNGEEIKLDVAPAIISGRAMVPLRFVQEQLMPDCSSLEWNGKTKEVTINNIPLAQLDCNYVSSLQEENENLIEENKRLNEKIDELERENDPLPEEDTIPPIEYSKNGIIFTLKSVTKERGPIVDGDHTYHLRLNVKIRNLTESSCRFPADRTKMFFDGTTYNQVGYDKTFINSIPGGAERSGWIRFPLKTSKKTVKFEFVIWPSDAINHFDFFLKVNLDEAIPNSTRPSLR